MQQYIYIIGVALTWVMIAAAIVHVVMDNRQPAKTMAWALVIFFVPVVGLVFYLFFGLNHRKERLIDERSLDQLSKRSMWSFVEQQDLNVPERYRQLVDLFAGQSLSLPFRVGGVDALTDGYAFTFSLLADIAQARHHIHMEMYIIDDDALGRLVADALTDRARQSVRVRIVYDDVGCWHTGHRFFERLRAAGVEVAPFLPVRFPQFTSKVNYRNHRKLIVIDGRVGYIGGMNIARRYAAATWHDLMLRMEGGIVYALQRAFLVDWYFVDRTLITGREYYPAAANPAPQEQTDGAAATTHAERLRGTAQMVTSGPTTAYPEIMQGYVRAIMGARRYIYIETPYFLPTDPVFFALKTAAATGVDVHILVPLRNDSWFVEWASRSYLREAHAAGIKVSLYSAGFLHTKLMVCDGEVCTCGSTNVDFRSFENNFEANVFVYDESTARRLADLFLADLEHAVSLAAIPARLHPGFIHRLWESLTRLFSPLL